ncbi:class I mannose-6-phosphate isomerase (plasmid) [Chloroflexota bacterium]|nr:class I mannose-6-phosphate isomerase [Chloroflexota bacterium]
MIFKSIFTEDVWGGRNLSKFGRELPEGKRIGQSWDIADHKDGMTEVSNGKFAGKNLTELIKKFGVELVGSKFAWFAEQAKFPLMVKLLEAGQNLSLQVHPNDAWAKTHLENELGKNEMWVVLDAEPGASVTLGLAEKMTPEQLVESVKNGTVEDKINIIPIKVGDYICVPAGSIHALMAGAVVAEIQQNSNTTYRVYDWNRPGFDGKLRPLQTEQAVEVSRFDQVGLTVMPPRVVEEQDGMKREKLCVNETFTTERVYLEPGAQFNGNCDGSTLEIWGVLEGQANVAGIELDPVKFTLLPAALGTYTIQSAEGAVLLRAYAGE